MQEDERGSCRSTIASLPVAQRGDRESEIARELRLREVKASANRTNVDRSRCLRASLARRREVGPPAIGCFVGFIYVEGGVVRHLEWQFFVRLSQRISPLIRGIR